MVRRHNKWQFELSLTRDVRRMERGWKIFRFGIYKIHTFPPPGAILGKKYYKGFIFSLAVFLPVERV